MYLDTVKGLTIFLVVFGHCIQYFNGSEFLKSGNFFDDIVFKIIYSFHMPLFALVSGYLFYSSFSRRTPREIIAKQARSLILPAFSWALLTSLIRMCKFLIMGEFLGYEFFIGVLRSFTMGLWFLWAMFWCSLAVVIAEKFFHGRIAFYMLLVVLSLFLPNKLNASANSFMYPYFVAGYIWHREGFDTKINALPSWLKNSGSIAVIAVWLVMLAFFGRNSYIYTTGISLIKYKEGIFVPSQLWTDIFRWAIGFAGSCSVMILLKLVKPLKILALIGSKTIGIYIMSGYIFRVRPEYGGYIINFIEAVIITALCYTLTVIISRNKMLNKFLLGGR